MWCNGQAPLMLGGGNGSIPFMDFAAASMVLGVIFNKQINNNMFTIKNTKDVKGFYGVYDSEWDPDDDYSYDWPTE